MTAYPVVKPFSFKTGKVTFTEIGGTELSYDFSDHINQVSFEPTSATGTFTAINSSTLSDVSPSTWQATFGLVQDLDPAGFLRFLLQNEGKKFTVEIFFAGDADPCEIVLTARSAGIGGSADGNLATSTVTLPADGKPNFTA